jgi:hypothetical protein
MTPQLAARKFLESYQRDYGRRHPAFLQTSFQEAAQQASREGLFLVVYLHSPLHEDTADFCRNTLNSEALLTFLEGNLVAWGGSIVNPDAYQTSILLEASAFPFLALLVCQPRNVEVVDKLEGNMNPDQVDQGWWVMQLEVLVLRDLCCCLGGIRLWRASRRPWPGIRTSSIGSCRWRGTGRSGTGCSRHKRRSSR